MGAQPVPTTGCDVCLSCRSIGGTGVRPHLALPGGEDQGCPQARLQQPQEHQDADGRAWALRRGED